MYVRKYTPTQLSRPLFSYLVNRLQEKNHDLKTANKLFKNNEIEILRKGANKLKSHLQII